MKFEEYARDWLNRQDLIKSTLKTTRQALEIYCFPAIGDIDIANITESDIDRIFFNERLFNRRGDFIERVMRVLTAIFDEIMERRIIKRDPVLHIYCPVVLSHERLILEELDVELTNKSPFVDVSCMWLKEQGYKPVTYNLYYHFLNNFIHPFIGKKQIGLVDQNNIRKVYTYFNTVNTNETWTRQIHLVMRMVFQYAIDKGIIIANPLLNINDPRLKPIIELDRNKKNAVRAAFSRYGFRKTKLKELSKELYGILNAKDEYVGRTGASKTNITFYEVFQQWHRNTQAGILSAATAESSFHSMDVYTIPNFGDKPIQEIALSDIQTVLDVYALMGNTADWYIIARLRSLYDYAIERGYVSVNLACRLKSANNPAAVKLVLSDKEIKSFFTICDEIDTMYSCMFVVALCTGLRIREAMALAHYQIDTELKTVKIQSMIKDGKLVPAVKTRRGRKIRLSKTALANLERAKRHQQVFEKNEGYYNEYGLVFTTKEGRPLSYTTANRNLEEIVLKMGRPDLTNHSLRHTYMTVSTRCGENLDEIQNEVGHGYASDVITEYLHQTDESRHESAIRRQEYLMNIMSKYGAEDGN